MPAPDTRRVQTVEMEVRIAGDTATCEGYASTFNQPYQVGWFNENVRSGAFTKTLSEKPDVRFLINHAGLPLARTSAGTLDLAEDSSGLHQRSRFNMQRNDVRDAVHAMKDGDATQMSFSFRMIRDTWDDAYENRDLNEVSLQNGDVSLVTFPANEHATVSIRARKILDADHEELRAAFRAIHEERAGKTISAATQKQLEGVLESLATIDSASDDALMVLSGILGVDNPDQDDNTMPSPRSGTPTSVVRARLRLAGLNL